MVVKHVYSVHMSEHHSGSPDSDPPQQLCLKTRPSWTVPHQYVDLELQADAGTSHTDVAL